MHETKQAEHYMLYRDDHPAGCQCHPCVKYRKILRDHMNSPEKISCVCGECTACLTWDAIHNEKGGGL